MARYCGLLKMPKHTSGPETRGQVSNLNPLAKEVGPFRHGSFLWNFEDTETHQLAGRLRKRSEVHGV